MCDVEWVQVDPRSGLHGDRYQGRSGKRHATLIQAEHFPVVASCVGLREVLPENLGRNFVVRGLNLKATLACPQRQASNGFVE